MKGLLFLITFAIVFAVIWSVRNQKKATEKPPSERYVRKEDESITAFYKPYAEFMERTPEELDRFVSFIQTQTDLPRHEDVYPADSKVIGRAASAFAQAASDVFGFNLSLENDDAHQLGPVRKRWFFAQIGAIFWVPKNSRGSVRKRAGQKRAVIGESHINRCIPDGSWLCDLGMSDGNCKKEKDQQVRVAANSILAKRTRL